MGPGAADAGELAGVAAAFFRYDVFTPVSSGEQASTLRASAWFQCVNAWVLSRPGVRALNRDMKQAATNKIAVLALAEKQGLRIPRTRVSNLQEHAMAMAAGGGVTKPVTGGDYCRLLQDVLPGVEFRHGRAPLPAFLQERLSAPEIRLYVVGEHRFAFEMRSSSLDYREHQDVDVLPVEVPAEVEPLRALMACLGMDFGAADFKTDPATGKRIFLELNNSPMIANFDQVAQGAIADAIVRTLLPSGGV
ncbi:hypothetical protein D0B54_03860 [Solimonas sp. K1W22B-7]|nr:hypothetical protein D0B54_03860 [Solimonas sp. K1W22B-7]